MTLRAAIRRFWKRRIPQRKKGLLKFRAERIPHSDYYWSHHSSAGHMTFTGESGHLTSIADPSAPTFREFWIFDALERLTNGLECLLSNKTFPLEEYIARKGPPVQIISSQGKTTFVLTTELDAYTLRVWFVKNADGTIVVRSLPESDAPEDAVLDQESVDGYRAMFGSFPGDSYGDIVSELGREQFIQAIVEGLIELSERQGEQAVERKDEDGYHESLICYLWLQSYIARCLEW
ncbi:MAG: hypothetical protein OXT69_10280 [Candidatus Poribacteria bacterium]|nr:hypothetical protein [Candidatus Poribacteria bacterium]